MYEKGRIILAKQNSVIIDPGHGGSDPGAVYGNRREKDDTLALAYDIGNALEQRGIRVEYTRIGDIYNSPYEKAEIGNRSAADLFLSIHRNAMPVPGTGSGTMSLIFGRGGDAETFARNINKELAKTGWKDLSTFPTTATSPPNTQPDERFCNCRKYGNTGNTIKKGERL